MEYDNIDVLNMLVNPFDIYTLSFHNSHWRVETQVLVEENTW